MNEIICPHCHKAFKVDEAGYAHILKQVRDREFANEIRNRLELAEKEKLTALELAKEKAAADLQRAAAANETELLALKARLDKSEEARKLAVAEALAAVERERDKLAADLEKAREAAASAAQLAEMRRTKELQETAAQKDADIQALQARLQASGVEQQLAVTRALDKVTQERLTLQSSLEQTRLEKEFAEKALKERYEIQLKDRDEAIERLRDMKARLSTKMVGETLEQHCEVEFNRLRSTAFPRAYFEKDNDARSGSKGDYIFRDSDEAAPKSSPSCLR
jgi:hypothetical protein